MKRTLTITIERLRRIVVRNLRIHDSGKPPQSDHSRNAAQPKTKEKKS